MFIISKRNFLIQIPGRAPYRIPKDYIGEIPDDIAAHWMNPVRDDFYPCRKEGQPAGGSG